MIKVINIKSGDPYDVYIGRANPAYGLAASKWHNPFKLERIQPEVARWNDLKPICALMKT